MKFLAYVHENFEDAFIRELLELVKIKEATSEQSCVIFEIKEKIQENIAKIILYSRSIRKLIILNDSFEATEQEEIIKNLEKYYENKKEDITSFLKELKSDFKIETFKSQTKKHQEVIEVVSHDLDAEIGSIILKNNEKLKVKLENPDLTLLNIIINNKVYHGIDLLGLDVTKRDYKIFTLPNSIKSSLIFSIFYKYMNEDTLKNIKKKTIVNYSISDGSFLIELAQKIKNVCYLKQDYRNLNIHKYFDLLQYIEDEKDIQTPIMGLDNNFNSLNVVKKNLALSGVKDIVKLSRLDLTWLDTKYDEKTIDYLFSFFIPNSTAKDKELLKYVDDLLYQLEFVLKGKAVILTIKPEIFNEAFNKKVMKIKISEKLNFAVGTNNYCAIVIERK